MATLHQGRLTGANKGMPASLRQPRIENAETYNSIDEIEKCIDDILKGYRVLVLLRGLPGSGKSHLARTILRACYPNPKYEHHIHSADNFFMNRGRYNYEPRQIGEAHQWNQRNVEYRMQEGYSPLIVDNTNTEIWEMRSYAGMAVRNGYKIRVLEVNTRWCFSCKDLTTRNQHNVPKKTIQNMLERYEMGITAEKLLETYQCPTIHQENPLFRRCPPLYALPIETNGSAYDATNPDLSLPRSKKKVEDENYNGVAIPETSTQDEGILNDVSNLSLSPNAHSYFGWDTGFDSSVVKGWRRIIESPKRQGGATDKPVKKPATADIGTNTAMMDSNRTDFKVMYGRNREITETRKETAVNRPGMLEKGCWTGDDVLSDRDEDLRKLTDIFQNVPPAYIRDMYDDCKGDFDMTFEIFLEDSKDYLSYGLVSNTNHDQFKEEREDTPVKSLNEVEDLPPESPRTSSPMENWLGEPSAATGAIKKKYHETTTTADESMTPDSMSDDENSDLESQTPPFDNCNVELNLGEFLVRQLVAEFGDPSHDFPLGLQPVVQVPKALARQLYAFYVESVYQQMDNQQCIPEELIREDEAFAKKLQEEEDGVSQEPPEGLQDIMNEQAAMKLHKKQMPVLKTPNDLATQLTKRKLFETFPNVDQDVILELYHANALNYKQTVDDLIASVGQVNVASSSGNIRDPPISESTMQELEEAHIDAKPLAKLQEENEKSATEYREKAEYHLKKRNELYQKAQEHHGRGETEVAQFYSVLAQQQTKYYDIANSKAATVFLGENSKQLQNMNTLDLHYLFVKEAVVALDVFIDSKIEELNAARGKQTQDLLIITGRGNRSLNGVSKIKPAVMRRLETRKIRYHKMNPGLLRIKIKRTTPVTNDL